MKKILLVLTILFLAGCGQSISASVSRYKEHVLIPIQPPRSLEDLFSSLDKSITVHALDIIEEEGRAHTMAFAPPTNDIEEALRQYDLAYSENLDFLKRLLSTGKHSKDSPEYSSYDALKEKEIEKLNEIANKAKLPSSIIIKSAYITGPRDVVAELKNYLMQNNHNLAPQSQHITK